MDINYEALAKQFGGTSASATLPKNSPIQNGVDYSSLAKQFGEVPNKSPNTTIQTSEPNPSIGGFLGNVVKSTGDVIGGTAQAILHPLDTVSNITKTGAGLLEKGAGALTGRSINSEDTQKVDALVNYFGQRYGGKSIQEVGKNIAKTAYKDPAGFLLDLSTVLGGAGAISAKIGKIGEIENLTRAGKIASGISEATNPITQIGKMGIGAIKNIGKGTGFAVGQGLGITTGAGYGAIKEAFSNPNEAFTKALRGQITGEDIANAAKQSLGAIKQARHDDYLSQLNKLKESKQTLDISPINKEVSNQLKKFYVGIEKDGTLDFSRSSLRFNRVAQQEIQTIYDEMKSFGTKTGDRTVIGVDNLKQSFRELYSQSSQSRAFVQAISSKTRNVLKNVEGYDKLASDYETKTKSINEITKGLSLGNKASVDTSIRKLTSIFKQDNNFREDLVKELEQYGGKDLKSMAAGYQLNPATPRGIIGRLEEIGGGATAIRNPTVILHPAFLAGIAAASPRVVGEFLHGLGLSRNAASNFLTGISKTNPHLGELLMPKIRGILSTGYYSSKSKMNDIRPQ